MASGDNDVWLQIHPLLQRSSLCWGMLVMQSLVQGSGQKIYGESLSFMFICCPPKTAPENKIYWKIDENEEVKWSAVPQLCLTLCYPMDHSPPGSSVHGIFQAIILEWAAMPSRRSSWPRDWTCISCIVGGFFTHSDFRNYLLNSY